jgi:Tol biopolymer transport system component
MNDRSDLDGLVTQWLRAGAPSRAPQGVLATALDRVAGVAQERPFGGRRFDDWIAASPRLRWALVAALLAAALIGAVVGVGALIREFQAVPPSGASNGWVAFAVTDGRFSPSEIYLVREGVPERRLVGSGGHAAGIRTVCPSFSPDGTRLAYSEATITRPDSFYSNATGGWGESSSDMHDRFVVIIGLDRAGSPTGASVRIPVDTDQGEACPTWSPDGQHLAYLASGSPQPAFDVPASELWVVDLDGTTRKLAESPKGYAGGLRPNGPSPQAGLAWAPDGSAIAALDNVGIWMVQVAGGAPQLALAWSARPSVGSMAWSPDATRIVVAGNSVRVFYVDDPGHLIELSGDGRLAEMVSWSPDGNRIAYLRATYSAAGPERSDIVTVSPAGGDERVVASDRRFIRGLVWSPDSLRLLYAADDGPTSGALMSVSAAGESTPTVLTQQPHYLENTSSRFISWQPVFP